MAPASFSPPVLIERAGGVLTFVLNRPEAGNEVSAPMFEAMVAALRREVERPTARVLRLRAAGEVFCAGRERAGRDAETLHAEVSRLIELKRLLRSTSLISVAQVQGDALGFGFGIAILCDFTLVSSRASLGFPEMRKGLPPAAIMAYLGNYGRPKQLFPMLLFGDAMTPADALQAGLVTQIAAPARLQAETDALIARVVGIDDAGARQCKAFFQAAQEGSVEQNFRCATELLTATSLRIMQRAGH
ncbi:putative enoyl-CoA hydratase echA6 [compost metagenome]|uniref:Enoyl-CoA hydratase/isomerase family protein n=1 Tax=Cupriavidus campinensis TaxID=151783 RepID=A0AAE9I246_9BURK|nr:MULTISPECIES: enoyl-CoA hydratase/isomerase family protein [Cupriavidus]TSP12210.1 enoyl-CoA hydratase/isomerase family protein [Cupriavidus campinensis]URF06139.1 enoyl-CoA hydratase/isomerase family protein [Cupriavidus campinensis]CAG2129134.1 putative enoyl-CoA hydratase echA6 [Cupriavidus campinensis]